MKAIRFSNEVVGTLIMILWILGALGFADFRIFFTEEFPDQCVVESRAEKLQD